MNDTYNHHYKTKYLKTASPFVKWVGGKRGLLPEIKKYIPQKFNSYFEPFAGGGALFFSLANEIKHGNLFDRNLELVITYKAIKENPSALIKKLTEHSNKHSKNYYYKIRSEHQKDPISIAARFLYLNKTCYNGLYRVNKSGQFNVPMGNYKNPNIIQEQNIILCHEALRKTQIGFGDFEQINPNKGDFVYFDPPYHPTSDVSFTAYTKENFTEKDQVRLRNFVLKLHKKGVHVMVSNSKTKFIEDLYKLKIFKKHTIRAPRFINCKPGGRGNVEELVITNY